ncbi:hypothetical protein SpCBS45565_g04789 [Spizellomyces sp. 'palustris']|nr:hypothetical protein SpCBS45565_g04789 [Spizellomyces sp. 'palustris']
MDTDTLQPATAGTNPSSSVGIMTAPAKRKVKIPPITAPPSTHSEINTYDWRYEPDISFDDNYIDLACLVARNSLSQKGHMGAVLIRPPSTVNAASNILMLATNVPVYPPPPLKNMKASAEIHAEANAVSSCTRQGIKASGAWAYITFPPCKECFMLLVYAGIKRIVFRRKVVTEGMWDVAKAWGVELVERRDMQQDANGAERCREWVRMWEEKRGEPDDIDAAASIPSKRKLDVDNSQTIPINVTNGAA